MNDEFRAMTENMLANLTNVPKLPEFSQVIATMSVKQGGLAIQSPRTNAIISFMSTTKRCLQYVQQGIWLGEYKPRPLLPRAVTILYDDWQTSNNRMWKIFNKYLPDFNNLTKRPESPTHYVFKTSVNASREKAKEFASDRLHSHVLKNELITPPEVIKILPGLLDKRTSMALMTMSRSQPLHRLKNEIFTTALKRKLRLPIIDDNFSYNCKCGANLDVYGDHCLGCQKNHKGKASDGIRDEIVKVFQRILPIAKMISSPTQVETEIHNTIKAVPRLKPFDLSIRLDSSLDTGAWRTPYSRIGFDVTIIHSNKPLSSTTSKAAEYPECDLRLRDGERSKFMRARGGTNDITKQTLSPDEVIGEILNTNSVLIPIAVGPFGNTGSLFNRFMDTTDPLPLPDFPADKPNAARAAKRAVHHRTPYDVLGKADRNWKEQFGDMLFDGSYLANSPSNWANQRIGLAMVTHLSNHINTSLTKIKLTDTNGEQRETIPTRDEEDGDGWKYYIGAIPGEAGDEIEDAFGNDTLTDLGEETFETSHLLLNRFGVA